MASSVTSTSSSNRYDAAAPLPRERPTSNFALSVSFFLRSLGLIHLIAFISFWSQLSGLIGPRGILPADVFLEAAFNQAHGDAYAALPTLCWIFGGSSFLHVLCAVGVAAAVLLIAGLVPIVALVVLWICYLSLVNVSQIFLSFQWDILLLETTWLAAFVAPRTIFPGWRLSHPKPIARWLLIWLLFRLMLLSGVVKLSSGDPTWRTLSALRFHFETQPLPNPLAWWAHQLPDFFHRVTCAATFAIELVAPLFLFAPRKWRHLAAVSLIGLQLGIAATGNFAFFNLLTIALCLLAFDDQFWRSLPLIGERCGRYLDRHSPAPAARAGRPMQIIAIGVIFVSSLLALPVFMPRLRLPAVFSELYAPVSSLYLVNNYGLFAVMTTSRPELIFEGSDDGKTWREYEFPYKPGSLTRPPPVVAPHQPRLDWQLWFAALTPPLQNNWVLRFCEHLLRGTPEVVHLLKTNPFPDRPPLMIRVLRYDYHFTNSLERQRTGRWWRRELQDVYFEPMSLK